MKGLRIDRDQLKQMIDEIPEQDALEVYDFIGYLNMKREKETLNEKEFEYLAKDEELIRQVQKSREDRRSKNYYSKEDGLKYLRNRFEES